MAKFLRSGWLYFIVFLFLVLAGYLSAKGTLNRMRQSGKKCDAIFFSIVDEYRSLDSLLNRSIPDTIPPFYDLRPDVQTDWPESDRANDLSFAAFNAFRLRMVDYDLYLEDIVSRITATPFMETLADTLATRRDRLIGLKTKYNVQTRNYNTFIKQFPRNFYSSFFHFQARHPFELNSQLETRD